MINKKQGKHFKKGCYFLQDREKMRSIAMLLLIAMVCTLLPISALAEQGRAPEGTTIDLLDTQAAVTTPGGIFQTLTLSVEGSSVDTSGKMQLKFNFAMDDAVRETIYEAAITTGSVLSYPDYVETYPGGDYGDYLNTCSDEMLSKIEFSYQLNSDAGLKLNDVLEQAIQIDGKNVGVFRVEPVENQAGMIQFTCSLNKELYHPEGFKISGGGAFSVEFNRGDLGGQKPVLKWDEATANVTILFPNAPSVDLSGTKFSVTKKTINPDTGSPYLDYEVTLTSEKATNSNAEQVYLNKLLFVDQIPAGLQVTTVQVTYTFEGGTTDTKKLNDFTLGNQKLSFTLPQQPEKITKAVFTINTCLSESEYKKYLGPTLYQKKFTNKAFLYLPGTPDEELGKAEVTNEIKHFFLQKDGQRVGLNSRKFLWNIKVSAYFYHSSNVYLVDCIDNAQVHQLDTNGQITITWRNGQAAPNTETLGIEQIQSNAMMAYNAITKAEHIQAMLPANPADNTAYYYNLENTDGVVTQQILLIPLKDQWLHGSLELKYDTDVLTAVHPDEITSNLVNKVKIIWENLYSPGVGSGTAVKPPNWDITKKVTTKHAIVSKSGVGYDKAAQTVRWQFDVNQYGTDISEVTITDMIDADQYQLLGLGAGKTITVTPYDRTTKKTQTKMTIPLKSRNSTGNYYTLEKENGKTILKIHLVNIEAQYLYRFTIQAKVVDADVLFGTQDIFTAAKVGNAIKSKPSKAENTITVTATVNGTEITQIDSASQRIEHTLLQKSVIRPYHYGDHDIRWQIKANPEHLPIQNLKLTDTLPENTVYNGAISAVCFADGKNKAAIAGTIDNQAGIITFQNGIQMNVDTSEEGQVTFEVTDAGNMNHITDCFFQIQLSAQYPEAYRTKDFKNGQEITALNTVAMTGKVYDRTITATAKAQAKFKTEWLQKSGIYHHYNADNPEAYVDWTIDVNRDGLDFGLEQEDGTYVGTKIMDELVDGFVLQTDSVKLYALTFDKNNRASMSEITEDFDLSDVKDSGFQIIIPAEHRATPLRITFRTTVVGDMNKDDMTNKVKLIRPRMGAYEEASDAQNSQNFTLQAFAKWSKRPILTVEKVSTQTINNKPVSVDGAGFTLTEGKQTGNGWEFSGTGVTQTTKGGKTTFLRLQSNVVYKLTETTVPNGYRAETDKPIYLMLPDKAYHNDNLIVDGQPVLMLSSLENNAYYYKTQVKNIPQLGNIVGYKLDEHQIGLADAEIGLFANDTVAFTEDNALATCVTSHIDENMGSFSFAGLEPGTYQIKELAAPEGYYLNDSTVLKVTLEPADCADSHGNGAVPVTVDVNGSPLIIQNEQIPTAGAVKGTKVNEKGIGLEGAVIGLTKMEQDQSSTMQTTITNVDGSFQFDHLQPGMYQLEERKAPEGYAISSDRFTITLTKEDCDPNAAPITVGKRNDALFTSALQIVDNRLPVFGAIKGLKTNNSNLPLAGAVIGLFAQASPEVILQQTTTAEDGVFQFQSLEPGMYFMKEIQAPPGYRLNTTVFPVVLTEEQCKWGEAVTTTVDHTALVVMNYRNSSGGGITPDDPVVTPTDPIKPEEPEIPVAPDTPIVTPEQPEDQPKPNSDLPTELPDPNDPDSPEEITILDEGVPKTYVKVWDPEDDEFVYIPEEDVPLFGFQPDLGEAPNTGDTSPILFFVILFVGSIAGLLFVAKKGKKKV